MAAIGKAYTLHAVERSGTGPIVISQISEHSHNEGVEMLLTGSMGKLSDQFGALQRAEPIATFTTTDIKAVLDILSASGAPVYAIASAKPIDLWYAELDETGFIKTSGATHVKISVTNGLVVPRTLPVDHQGEARITVEVHAISTDGVTNPITITTGAAAPPTTAAPTSVWTVGPYKIDSTLYHDVQSLNVDFGINVLKLGGSGSVWPTYGGVNRPWRPIIRVDVLDVSQLDTVGETGRTAIAATTVFFLRKKAADGAGNVADGTAEHISFSIYDGVYGFTTPGGTFGEVAQTSLEFTAFDGGANDALDINTATAIA